MTKHERGCGAGRTVDDLLPTVFETADAYAFFAREFFPGPGCATARKTGIELYETLLGEFPETLVRDRFRLDIGWSFLIARASSDPGRSRPAAGSLGREHLLFYLPLGTVLGLPRYRIDGEETR
jgi:hypothetical protein